ncbi:MAG: divergent polysaccharide deacetylase family protein [Synergistaceae bacterium]|nr:divergent polysaccharide deacetylase family protein [Synergistaceae bacterium]
MCGMKRARRFAARAYGVASLVAVLLSGIVGASFIGAGAALRWEIQPPSDAARTERIASGDMVSVTSRDEGPKLAIVLDDCGANMAFARRVASLDIPMTWAIIPRLKYSAATAELLEGAGIPYIVHVPMQAWVDPDGHAGNAKYYYIGAGMSGRDVRSALTPLLDSFGGAFGVNNHRGSKATEDLNVMEHVMDVLAERDLFFLDSRTSSRSVAYDVAVKRGLASARNSFFLDNESDRDEIARKMASALSSAKKRGMVVAICHLRPETVVFLEKFSSEVASGVHKSGVGLVTLPEWAEYAKGDKR